MGRIVGQMKGMSDQVERGREKKGKRRKKREEEER